MSSSPPRSLDCREIPPFYLRNTRTMPAFRDYSPETGLQRTDCALRRPPLSGLFSGGHMRSPVSRRALGECNAITSGRFSHGELTFASTLETEVAKRPRPQQRTIGTLPVLIDSLCCRRFCDGRGHSGSLQFNSFHHCGLNLDAAQGSHTFNKSESAHPPKNLALNCSCLWRDCPTISTNSGSFRKLLSNGSDSK